MVKEKVWNGLKWKEDTPERSSAANPNPHSAELSELGIRSRYKAKNVASVPGVGSLMYGSNKIVF